jgi:hypothetical protein
VQLIRSAHTTRTQGAQLSPALTLGPMQQCKEAVCTSRTRQVAEQRRHPTPASDRCRRGAGVQGFSAPCLGLGPIRLSPRVLIGLACPAQTTKLVSWCPSHADVQDLLVRDSCVCLVNAVAGVSGCSRSQLYKVLATAYLVDSGSYRQQVLIRSSKYCLVRFTA